MCVADTMSRPGLPPQAVKKDASRIHTVHLPALPKRARRAVTGLSARLRTRSLSCFLLALCALATTAVLAGLLTAVIRHAHVPSADSSEPLSSADFASLRTMGNASSRPLFDRRQLAAARKHWAQPGTPDQPRMAWDVIADDVAIAVKTGHEVAGRRLQMLRTSGWLGNGRRVPNLLVVSDDSDPARGIVGLKRYALDVFAGRAAGSGPTSPGWEGELPRPARWFAKEGWLGDKDKNLPALHMLRATFPNAKWYALLDDDTHLFLDNFARYASRPDRNSRPIYTGKVFYISNCGGFARSGAPRNDPHGARGLFVHGGAGIFVNAKAMDALFPRVRGCISRFSGCWAGDMQVGLCMHAAGIPVNAFKHGHSMEYQFTPFWPSRAMADARYTRRLRSRLEPVTFHKIPLKEQKLISEFERAKVTLGQPVGYGALTEYLLKHGVLPMFGKRKTRWDTNVFFPKIVAPA